MINLRLIMRIKDISKENRPRERFLKKGATVLSDAELLAIILQKGNKKENVTDMCNKLIMTYGIDKLSELSFVELQTIYGIGPAKAMQIKAVFEFNKRHEQAKQKGKKIKTAKDVFDYCYPILSHLKIEKFMVLHLNTANRIIKDEVISTGTLNSFLIHPREVFKSAIKENANSIILVHNHPSGNIEPSEEDDEITKMLFDAGELLSIKVLDHIIIGGKNHHSYKDN